MALGRSSAGDDAALRRNAAASARGLLHLSLRFRHRQIVVRLEGRIYSPVSLVLADHGGRTVHARHTARHYRELQEKEINGLYRSVGKLLAHLFARIRRFADTVQLLRYVYHAAEVIVVRCQPARLEHPSGSKGRI